MVDYEKPKDRVKLFERINIDYSLKLESSTDSITSSSGQAMPNKQPPSILAEWDSSTLPTK